MMKPILVLVAACLALAGCAHTPTGLARPVVLPPLPSSLATPPGRLPAVTDPTLRGITTALVDTSAQYNDLAARYQALVRLYSCVVATVGDGEKDCPATVEAKP